MAADNTVAEKSDTDQNSDDKRRTGRLQMSEGVWRTFDSLIKGLGASVITGIILFYGFRFEQNQTTMRQKAESLNALVEFSVNQKNLDVNIGMRMFETLLARFFEKDKARPGNEVTREDLLLLRLIALNFQDVPINLKPMFEDLNNRLTDTDSRKLELRGTAQEVARRQAFRMTFVGGFDSGRVEVKTGDKYDWVETGITAEIGKISPDETEVTLVVDDQRIGPFSVGYFDTPLIDNVKLPGGMRISVIPLSSDGQTATLRFIAFQSDLAADRFDIKEMSRDFVDDWTDRE